MSHEENRHWGLLPYPGDGRLALHRAQTAKTNELVKAIANDTGLTRDQARKALESMLANVAQRIAQEGRVTLVGFGTFSTSRRAERRGRNPITGEQILIPAKTVIRFRPDASLNSLLNERQPEP